MSTRKLFSTVRKTNLDIFDRVSGSPLIKPIDVTPSDPRLKVIGVLNPTFINISGKRYLVIRVDERPKEIKGKRSSETLRRKKLLIAYTDLDCEGKIDIHETIVQEPYLQDMEPILPESVRGFKLGTCQQELLLSYISHLRIAKLEGDNITISPKPLVYPSDIYTQYGCEDPRATFIEGKPLLLFTAIGQYGATAWLATITRNNCLKDKKMLLGPDHKHTTLFPEKVDDKYCLITRPLSRSYLRSSGIWVMKSHDMIHWGEPSPLLLPRPGMWDGVRIGPSTTPLRIPPGWLLLYYAVDSEDTYQVGAALLENNDSLKVISRCSMPLLSPTKKWERIGRRADTIFPCGIEVINDNVVRIYYGAADTYIGIADVEINRLLDMLDPQ